MQNNLIFGMPTLIENKNLDKNLNFADFNPLVREAYLKSTKKKDLPFIIARENHLAHFHIHDGTENPPKNHLALGDGCIDLPTRLNLAQKHNCTCVLETKTIAALEKSVDWLRQNPIKK